MLTTYRTRQALFSFSVTRRSDVRASSLVAPRAALWRNDDSLNGPETKATMLSRHRLSLTTASTVLFRAAMLKGDACPESILLMQAIANTKEIHSLKLVLLLTLNLMIA
jgi:hypothetical protein